MKSPITYFFLMFSLLLSNTSFAYIGPGAGITTIGAAVAFVVVLILLFLGFLWYPIKKIMNKGGSDSAKAKADEKDSDEARGL